MKQPSDKKSIINIIANSYETFGEIKEHQKWNNLYHLINDEPRMLCPRRSTFHPKCENYVLHFQPGFYLRFLEIIYDSVSNDVAYCYQNLFCNLYYIWVFANKYFSEKDIQFELFSEYFFSICDSGIFEIFLKKLFVPLCHARNYSVNLISYTYNASFLLTTHLSLNNWIWEMKNQNYRRY